MNDISTTMRTLRALCGSWNGHGRASYPTIGQYEYREQLQFKEDTERPLLFYEQRAEQREIGQEKYSASHWEAGFLLVTGPSVIRLTNAQDSGMLEVLELRLTMFENGFRLAGDALGHFNDPRMVAARRMFELRGNHLKYEVEMATNNVLTRTLHLIAELKKAAA